MANRFLNWFFASAVVLTCFSSAYAARGQFTDLHLQQVLANSAQYNTSGVIYTWSPHMNLSAVGTLEIQRIAQELNLELIILVDPQSREEEIQKVALDRFTYNAQVLNSPYLSRWGVQLHYPSLIIYKNGKFTGSIRPGYDEPGRVRAYILRSLQ